MQTASGGARGTYAALYRPKGVGRLLELSSELATDPRRMNSEAVRAPATADRARASRLVSWIDLSACVCAPDRWFDRIISVQLTDRSRTCACARNLIKLWTDASMALARSLALWLRRLWLRHVKACADRFGAVWYGLIWPCGCVNVIDQSGRK
jgi:hypothetical protein